MIITTEQQKIIDGQISATICDQSMFPAMAYEDGVRAALEWVLAGCPDDESKPMFND